MEGGSGLQRWMRPGVRGRCGQRELMRVAVGSCGAVSRLALSSRWCAREAGSQRRLYPGRMCCLVVSIDASARV